MRQIVLLAVVLLCGFAAADTPPRLAASIPAGGATEVAVDIGEIVVSFDRDMDPGKFAVAPTQEGVMPRLAGGVTWPNRRTARIPIAPLKEGISYAIGFKLEPMVVLRFATKGPGEPAAPTVTRTTPEFGAVDVDHDLREVLIEFSDDVRPGELDVQRLRGTADPTQASDDGPYLRTSRILVIPVRLEGGTTYGLQLNTSGKAVLAAKKSGRAFLPFQLVFTSKADERGLIGEWRWMSADKKNEMRLTFVEDGTYAHWSRLRGRETMVRGVWRDLGATVEIRPERRGPALVRYRRLGRGILDLKLGSAAPLRLRLHGVIEEVAAAEPKPAGWIVFTRTTAAGPVLHVMPADGSAPRVLWQQPAADPWWSSDYATLVCLSNAELWLADIGTMKVGRVAGGALTRPSVSFDRKYMVCISRSEQGADRMTVVRVASGRTVFTWDPTKYGGGPATYPRLSPDGRSIVFSYGAAHAESLAICRLVELLKDNPAPMRIVRSDGKLFNTRAAWSPDGRRIVFLRGRKADTTTGDLFVVDRAGTGLRQLTRTGANELPVDPCWSPDGRRIVFAVVDEKGGSDLWMIDADGTDAHRLTKDGVSGSPAWGRTPAVKPGAVLTQSKNR